jgi:hypothetical protein
LYPKDNITLGEERGNTFIMLLRERRKGDCGNAINSKKKVVSATPVEAIPGGQAKANASGRR